jgi:hypothetical protein
LLNLCDSVANTWAEFTHNLLTFQVHLKQLREILRDADIAYAISLVVRMFRAQQTWLELHVALFRRSFCSVITRAQFGRNLLDLTLSLPILPETERTKMEPTD